MQEIDFRIDPLNQAEVPVSVMAWFEDRSAMLIHPRNYRQGNFMAFYVIRHDRGDITYAARQTKTYDTDGLTEDLVHMIDIDLEGNEEGHAELRHNISHDDPYFKNKPFVGYTVTKEDLRNRGLGTRRLLMMNAMSQMLYGFPLHSSTLISDEAKRVWENLVAEAKALKFKENKQERFKFV